VKITPGDKGHYLNQRGPGLIKLLGAQDGCVTPLAGTRVAPCGEGQGDLVSDLK